MHNQAPSESALPVAPPYAEPAARGPYPALPPPLPAHKTNGFAIAALIASICGGVGLGSALGLAFGLTALSQIKRQPQKGRGLAVAALIISGLTTVICIVALAVVVVDEVRSEAAGIEQTAVEDLAIGDCISDLNGSSWTARMPVVPCGEPHEGQVYFVFTFPSGPFPGEATVDDESGTRCSTEFEAIAGPQDADMDVYYYFPATASDWRRDRGVVCIASDPGGDRVTSLFN